MNAKIIVYALSAGYLLACLLLLISDLKTFLDSNLFKHAVLSLLAGLIFLGSGTIIGGYLVGMNFAIVIVIISGLFMFPYLKGHLRNRHG